MNIERQINFKYKATDAMGPATKSAEQSIERLGSLAKTYSPIIAGVFSVATLAKATDLFVRQEQAIFQLEQRLKSTGGVVGLSSQQLQGMAASLQGLTTYGDEATIEMQALLLTFTNIRGAIFEQALPAVLDMSTAMGQDLKSSTLQLGKALNDPIKGVSALAEVGVAFTAAQKEQIRTLQESGRVQEAQTIILKELQTEFGGAAQAARQGLGGSLKALQNSFGDALEMIGSGGTGFIGAINEIEQTIASKEFQESLNTLATAIANIGVFAAKGITHVSEFFNEVRTTAEWWAAYSVGHISFFEWATTGADEAAVKLEQLKRQYGMLENQAGQRFKVPPRPVENPPSGSVATVRPKIGATKVDKTLGYAMDQQAMDEAVAGIAGFKAQLKASLPVPEPMGLGFGSFDIAAHMAGYEELALAKQELRRVEFEQAQAWALESFELQQALRDMELERERQAAEQKRMIWQGSAATFLSIGANLQALSAGQSRKMFEVSKAASIAGTIIDTYKGAQGAYTALASIPIYGPALGAAAAAAAIVAGMARVRSIESTQLGGAGGAISAGSSPAYGNFSGGGSPVTVDQPAGNTQQGPQEITIRLIGGVTDAYVEDEIIPRINSAQSRNVRIEFTRD